MNWFLLSIMSGLLVAFGMLLSKPAINGGVPVYLFVGIIGLVWVCGSGGQAILKHEEIWRIGSGALALAVAAGVFFWVENLFRFRAIPVAPSIAYVLLTIELTAAVVVLTIDILRMYQAGTLSLISWYAIGGVAFSIIALALFAMVPER